MTGPLLLTGQDLTVPCLGMALTAGARLALSPAATVNTAAVLSLADRGTITTGQRADLILLRHKDERLPAYEFGGNPVDAVICGGKLVAGTGAQR